MQGFMINYMVVFGETWIASRAPTVNGFKKSYDDEGYLVAVSA